jgi:LysR family pca operon transcriptional activator
MRHLRCFLAVAELGSATRAAERLGTVQPSVSRSLREFETEMGCALFDRGSGGLALNEAGRMLFGYVSSGLGQVDRGLETMRGQMGERRVVAFAMPNVVRVVMPGAVRRFKALYPEVDVELETVASGTLTDRLRSRKVDFGMGRVNSADKMAGLNFEHLYSEPLVFFVRAGHPLQDRAGVTIHDIDRHPVIIPSTNTIIRAEIDRYAISAGLNRFRNVIETVSFEFARNFLMQSDAVACLPLGGLRAEVAQNRVSVLDVAAPQLLGAVGLSTVAGERPSAPAQLLMQAIRDEVADLGLAQKTITNPL